MCIHVCVCMSVFRGGVRQCVEGRGGWSGRIKIVIIIFSLLTDMPVLCELYCCCFSAHFHLMYSIYTTQMVFTISMLLHAFRLWIFYTRVDLFVCYLMNVWHPHFLLSLNGIKKYFTWLNHVCQDVAAGIFKQCFACITLMRQHGTLFFITK